VGHKSKGCLLPYNECPTSDGSNRVVLLPRNLTSFRRHIKDFGVEFDTVGPGTNIIETIKMMAPGATSPQRIRVDVEIFSLTTYGKLMSGSTSENGRSLGVIMEKTAPTTAVRIMTTQSSTYEKINFAETRPGRARGFMLELILSVSGR
jgi:hypothetical protein